MRHIFAVVASLLIAGCGQTEQPADETKIVVTDDAGREVSLSGPAQRIVSLMPTVTDLIVAMGQADRLIARTDYDVDPRIRHLPSIGGGLTPSVEWIAAQHPDLVVAWPDNASRSLVAKIDAVGVPVYGARTDTIANTLTIIRNLGTLMDARASADSLEQSITSALDSVRISARGKKRVRVAYVLAVDPPTVAGPGTFINELIAIAGGENAFGDLRQPYAEINIEEIIARNPHVIVFAREGSGDAQRALASLPGWRDLESVRSGRVHRVSPDYFNRSGPLMPRAARELAQFFDQAR